MKCSALVDNFQMLRRKRFHGHQQKFNQRRHLRRIDLSTNKIISDIYSQASAYFKIVVERWKQK